MRHDLRLSGRPTESGSALSMALLASLVVAGLGMGMTTVSLSRQRDIETERLSVERRMIAEAGLAAAYADLIAGGDGVLGTAEARVQWGAGEYFTTCTTDADGDQTVTAYGKAGGRARGLCAVLRERVESPFFSAIFAGNGSGDADYSLELGGSGARADVVEGDVYSGNDITIGGDASVDGELRAGGDIVGASGQEGVTQDPPDLVGAHYEANHDVNVAVEFDAYGQYRSSSSLGGSAWRVPEENPAHIFRKNPSDRSDETSATEKNDYFLEDPYENVSSSNTTNPNNATRISLSGIGGEPGPSGTNKLYFIDGNLWIHNLNLYSFTIQHNEAAGVKVTFVVKGNVYISDNIVLKNKIKDGIALIAVKDPGVEDSGNIYFGDPEFGTLERMEAFMYAEGNFYDNNLGTSGSSTIEVYGVMTALDQVAINHGSGRNRTKLDLEFDSRIRDGDLVLPGVPEQVINTGRRTFDWVAKFEVRGHD